MPGVKDVQVVGVPSERYGEEVGAFIILHPDIAMNEEDVRDFCRGKISHFKIPKHIFFVESFPLTASGKIQKYILRELGAQKSAEEKIQEDMVSKKT
jgi:fatty-acyl-CoA synthase